MSKRNRPADLAETRKRAAQKKAVGRSRRLLIEIHSIDSSAAGLSGLNDGTNLRAELGAERLILKIDVVGRFVCDRLETEQFGQINLLRFLHFTVPRDSERSDYHFRGVGAVAQALHIQVKGADRTRRPNAIFTLPARKNDTDRLRERQAIATSTVRLTARMPRDIVVRKANSERF